MSTKIYNGYKIEKLMSAHELLSFCLDVGKQVQNKIKMEYKKESAILATHYIDAFMCGFFHERPEHHLTKNSPVLMMAQDIIQEEHEKARKDQLRGHLWDFSFSFSLFPKKNKILILLYTERDYLIKFWKELPNIQYYGYWDNSDPDENISKKEWKQREKDWESVWKLGFTPMCNSFHYDPIDYSVLFYTPYDEIKEYIPSFEYRVKKEAKNLFWQDTPIKEGKSDDIFRYIFEMERYLKTEEGQKELEKYKEAVSLSIPKEMTKELFVNSLTGERMKWADL